LERGNEKDSTPHSQRTSGDYKGVGGRAGKAEPNSNFKSRDSAGNINCNWLSWLAE
jgi:hypothetical protein